MKQVKLYTDGACSGNPGPGGWAYILIYKEIRREVSGGEANTTNNRMEMMAVLNGLNSLKEACHVHIYTDSKYVLEGATKWLKGWKEKGWRKADKKPVLNQDLWMALDEALSRHVIEWTWVKGHAGDVLNEQVDALACDQRDIYSECEKLKTTADTQ
ncbi:MAG: ribonuclease HI [Alphaproteobacteria bacterium]|nr:ribonuclease HI [Alphaproteobacteria bacterium]